MELLEDALLAKILGLIPRDDQLKLLRVSKRWYRVMDTAVGIDVFLGRGCDDLSEDLIFDSPKILGKVGVYSLEVDCFINDSTVLPKLKHPDLLKFVLLKDFISSRSLASILSSGVTNLHTMDIDQTVIFNLEFSDFSLTLPCQVLYIDLGRFFGYGDNNETADYEILAANTIYFFRKVSLPGLKRMLAFLACSQHTYEFVAAELTKFLSKHAENLTGIRIELVDKTGLTEAEDAEPFVGVPPDTEVQSMILPVEFSQLYYVKLRDTCYSRKTRLDWLKWALTSGNLEFNPNTNVSRLELFSPVNIGMNEAAVTKINIYLEPIKSPDCSFHCSVLKNCLNLYKLVIKNSSWLEGSELFHAACLPKSLVHLGISRLLVSCDDCHIICLQLPELKELTLDLTDCYSNGNLLGYGVPEDVAFQVIKQKKIMKFVFYTGSSAGPNSPNPLDEAYKIKARQISGILNDNNKYEIKISKHQNTCSSYSSRHFFM